jgi:very-short-patch-repair endonuclease
MSFTFLARKLRKNQTIAESVFWNHVRNRRFLDLKFTRQFVIEHSNIMGSKEFYIADFHCHALKMIVEIDGPIHLLQKDYDELRQQHLVEMGFHVIRFKNEEIIENWDAAEEQLRIVVLKRLEVIRK